MRTPQRVLSASAWRHTQRLGPSLGAGLLALLLLAAPASAEPKHRAGPYLGVAPGTRDVAPGKMRLHSKGAVRLISWVGFQMVGQGGRVFVQSTEPPQYELAAGAPDQIVLNFPDARLHSINDARKLETGFFPTAVLWVDAEQLKGPAVRVTIQLREAVGYDLRQEGNYLFLDFRAPTVPFAPPKQKNEPTEG